ncbi:MAG: uroporphyrin-III C-methyltransferase / precorrin-2 dehydrogenase / sirohydrochlorin ferrochelatase, partial [Pseudomonadota bacterium]|nr:uroporphyrin-III C-methyltransferase / precorrin-2 dehydrogenase / sirohydrochlorin ferrochelatase [Pseudomonadota bacterium]
MRYFPLFADLRGQCVLVVGGGEVAERKVRLLLEAGARVELVAPELTEWLQQRLPSATDEGQGRDGEGTVDWRALAFDPTQLDGAALVIAATSGERSTIAGTIKLESSASSTTLTRTCRSRAAAATWAFTAATLVAA